MEASWEYPPVTLVRVMVAASMAALGFNLVAGLVALRWVKPLFPGDPIQFLFGFILAALGYTADLEIMLGIAKEGTQLEDELRC